MNDTTFQGDGKVAYVPVVVNTKLQKPPTNADRIRDMTDEELAEWLAYSSMPKEVRKGMNNGAFESQADAFLWWLKQEARDGED